LRLCRGSRHDDGYLHCLKCGYILKGISEPRCPECGERI
jgi:rubrerythrin